MSEQNTIKSNLDSYKSKLEASSTNLLAVSKTHSAESIKKAYDLGQRDFGENKVQELESKSLELIEDCPEIRWHFIGSLQSNKINKLLAIKNLVSIHSIDSIKLLNKLLIKNTGKRIGLFLQVNTSNESEKSGFTEFEQVYEASKLFENDSNFFLQGLMTIGKIRTDDFETDAKECFTKLIYIRDKIGKNLELSMGMSSDFEIAIEMKSNWIRIGTGIFGKRL